MGSPSSSKQNVHVIQALKQVFRRIPRQEIPKSIQSDKGQEFLGHTVQNWVRDRGIKWFTTEDENTKASICERLLRSLKLRMWKVFMTRKSKEWPSILQDVLEGYNRTVHSSTLMSPNDAHTADRNIVQRVYNNLYGPGNRLDRGLKQAVLKPTGERVRPLEHIRFKTTKDRFEKGYTPNYTKEIFKVNRVTGTMPQSITTRERTLGGQSIKGSFYRPEVQKVGDPDKRRRYRYKYAAI